VEAVGDPGGPATGLDRLALAVLAREPAPGERAPDDDPHAVPGAGGEHLQLGVADEDRVGRLLADEALPLPAIRRPLRLHDLACREGRGSDPADLALVDEVAERPERVGDIGGRVGPVSLVESDVVGPEAPERVLDRPEDVL